MKELSEITALFVDHQGLYQPWAEKLAQTYKRVLYHDPHEQAFPTVNRAVIGDFAPSNPRMEVCEDFWPIKGEIDLCIFPDSQGAGLQNELAGQGLPVWGSSNSISIEQSRDKFIKLLLDRGLEIPPYQKIVGIEALRAHLRDKTDKWIKVSKFRGTMETYHWRSWDDDEAWLDFMAFQLGGVKNLLAFLVFDSVDTDIELGADTYCIDGEFPDLIMDGFEFKDKSYFGELKDRTNLPYQLQTVLGNFGPILGAAGHRNFWSMEVRVKGEHFYFLDPTPRAPLPGGATQMEIYGNAAGIIAAGAEGELVQPEPTGRFAAECGLSVKVKPGMWGSVRISEDLRDKVKLSGCCYVNGRAWFPPDDVHGEGDIGWLVAIGDTAEETIIKLLDSAKALPDGVCASTESLVDLLKEIRSAAKQGVDDVKVPEPEIVVQES